MKWIEEILNNHIDEEGKLNKSKAMAEVKTEFPKNAINKEVFNQKNDDLKAANSLVEELKKDNKDVESLQEQIDKYEEQVDELNKTRIDEKKTFTLKEKLKEAGAKDVDYMIYKMGEVETDEEGNVRNLDSKIKDLTSEYESMFEGQEETTEEPTDTNKGFEVLDNQLDDGNEPDANQQATIAFEEALGLQRE